jgi:hypothetical protein
MIPNGHEPMRQIHAKHGRFLRAQHGQKYKDTYVLHAKLDLVHCCLDALPFDAILRNILENSTYHVLNLEKRQCYNKIGTCGKSSGRAPETPMVQAARGMELS